MPATLPLPSWHEQLQPASSSSIARQHTRSIALLSSVEPQLYCQQLRTTRPQQVSDDCASSVWLIHWCDTSEMPKGRPPLTRASRWWCRRTRDPRFGGLLAVSSSAACCGHNSTLISRLQCLIIVLQLP